MNGMDKDNTYVLLIGASTYPNWQVMDIPNVQVNLKEFRALLSDPFYCGIAPEKIAVVEDENLEDTNNAIQEFFDNIQTPKATVLLYYSGHGLQSVKAMDDLFLATRNIREKTFEVSSIKISELRRQFSECIASRKILLLDCCYAGKIGKGFMSNDTSDSIAKLNEFEGTYIMAASSEYERAKFDAEDPNVPTKFTGKFIDVIKNGIDSDDEYCTLNSIYNQIRSSFHDQKDAPRPVQIGRDNIGNFPIFRNKKFTERVPKDEQVWNKIINSNSINAYNTFIDQFPQSQYTSEAVRKIKDIEDEAAWRKACNKNTIGGYWEYINNYDNHKEDAKKRLKDLSTIEQENEIWQNAIAENKVELFEEYRKNYPDGKHIDEVKTILEKLTRSEREESAWNAVNKENILSLNEYLTKFPSDKYYKEATLQIELLRKKDEERKKLEEEANLKKLEEERKRKNEEQIRLKQIEEEEQQKLTEQKLWEQVNSTNTIRAFNKYLKKYPEGKFVVDAREKIEALKKPSEGEINRPGFLTSLLIKYWKIITVVVIATTITFMVIKFKPEPSRLNPIDDNLKDSIVATDTTVSNAKMATDTSLKSQPSIEVPMSENLMSDIQKYSKVDVLYNADMQKIFDAISNAPQEQQQQPFVKRFVDKFNAAKEANNDSKK